MSKKTLPEKHTSPIVEAGTGKTAADLVAGSSQRPSQPDMAMMAQYGIKRVPVDYFHVGAFRYTSLADAVAQAKRMAIGAAQERCEEHL
ncbi:hypothetical protein [Kordiimonas marina]|uniref:hypothetical protein n=1 Tax=Kordiimonas marina TaxID=2872312 RepID=UPI001FF26DC0|nr:hypothetical protein [Kordiimonas marina]MCJ9429651.1 hypothetical protein [Kordiimonas marina]